DRGGRAGGNQFLARLPVRCIQRRYASRISRASRAGDCYQHRCGCGRNPAWPDSAPVARPSEGGFVMRFVPNEDQAAFLTVLDQMIEPHRSWHVSPDWSRHDWSTELDGALEASGFYDCAAEESLGLPAAAIMTYRLASLPVLVESAASSMVRALFASDLPRPVAVIDGRVDSITPYLPVARSVIRIGNDGVYSAVLPEGAVKEVESIFAYPMGVLATDGLDWQHVEADSAVIRDAWRVGLAAEMADCLKGGLDAVVTHVRDRHQFGRPLGSFQSIQHRLAGA